MAGDEVMPRKKKEKNLFIGGLEIALTEKKKSWLEKVRAFWREFWKATKA